VELAGSGSATPILNSLKIYCETDITAPTVTSASPPDEFHLKVIFSEAVTLPGSGAKDAFSIALSSNPASTLAVSAAIMDVSDSSRRTVLLTTAEQTPVSFKVTVSGAVKDLAGNSIVGGSGDTATFIGEKEDDPPGIDQNIAPTMPDDHSVKLTFDEVIQLPGDAASHRGYFTIAKKGSPGETLTINGVTVEADNKTVALETDEEQKNGTVYVITALSRTASDSVTDLVSNVVDASDNTIEFTGAGVAPTVVSATAPTKTTIQITFSEAVTLPGSNPEDAFTVYKLAAPAQTVSVTGATLDGGDPSVVNLVTEEMKQGESYTVEASASVRDEAGHAVNPSGDSANFTGKGAAPLIIKNGINTYTQDATHVVVEFDEPISITQAPAGNEDVFDFTPDLVIMGHSIDLINTRKVTLTTVEQQDGVNYEIRTVDHIEDDAGNIVSGTDSFDPLAGLGVAPKMQSIVRIDNTTIDVTLEENEGEMSWSDAGVKKYFTITHATGTLNVVSVSKTGAKTFRVITDPQQEGVTYTVTAKRPPQSDYLRDLGGNPVDATAVSLPLTVANVAPRVLSASANTPISVTVQFSETINLNGVAPQKYFTINNGLGIVSAAKTGNQTVLVTTDPQADLSYTITANIPNTPDVIRDTAGNAVSITTRSANFSGVPAKPKVSGLITTNPTLLKVNFSELITDNLLPVTLTGDPKLDFSIIRVSDSVPLNITSAAVNAGANYQVNIYTEPQQAVQYELIVSTPPNINLVEYSNGESVSTSSASHYKRTFTGIAP
jgi:hypothetical protein